MTYMTSASLSERMMIVTWDDTPSMAVAVRMLLSFASRNHAAASPHTTSRTLQIMAPYYLLRRTGCLCATRVSFGTTAWENTGSLRCRRH
jgi:hypothetical protein